MFVGYNTMYFIELVCKKQFIISNSTLMSNNINVRFTISYYTNEFSIVKFWKKNLYVFLKLIKWFLKNILTFNSVNYIFNCILKI